MLGKRVIPCLDVAAGRVVKGVRFQDLRDAGDPAELAQRYEAEGADEVVFLDITASHEGRGTMLAAVERTADALFIPLTVGGGVSSVEDVRAVLNAGADKVGVNTAALREPALVTEASRRFGAQCVVVAIDAKREGARWVVYTHGGRTRVDRDAVTWAREAEARGAGEILLTSMDADGTRRGYDLALTRAVAEAVHIPVVASGGCGSGAHIVEVLRETTADAALAASIFHYREATVADVKRQMARAGIPVRLPPDAGRGATKGPAPPSSGGRGGPRGGEP